MIGSMGFPKKLFRGLPLFALFGAFGTVLDALVSLPLFVLTGEQPFCELCWASGWLDTQLPP